MKKIILLFFVLNIIGCKNKQKSNEVNRITNSEVFNDLNNNIKMFSNNKMIETFNYSKPYCICETSKITDVGYLKKLCVKYFLKPNYDIKNIESLKKIWSGQLFSIGKSQIYKLNLKDVALSMGKNTLVVVSLDKNVMYRINLQQFEPTFIRSDLPPVFSGRYYYRGGGDFYSYSVENDTLYCFFESDLVTLQYSYDNCSCFKNNKLKLINKDLNNDGLIDLYFKGKKYNYCVGYASRTKNDTIVRDSISITYKYFLKKKGVRYYYEKG